MVTVKRSKPKRITPALLDEIYRKISENQRIRHIFPMGGKLNIDRKLPFLTLYRPQLSRWDPGTAKFVTGQASYLIYPKDPHLHKIMTQMVQKLVAILSKEFGAFLIIEIWAGPDQVSDPKNPRSISLPRFKLTTPKHENWYGTLGALATALLKTRIRKRIPKVEVFEEKCAPPDLKPIFTGKEAERWDCHLIGLEVKPVYRDLKTRQEYPLVRQSLQRNITRSLEKAFFEFVRTQTLHRPSHYQSLGKRALVKAVWEADARLADINEAFDLLVHLNPLNAQKAWLNFRRSKFEKVPKFFYPPLPIDPGLQKRKLFSVPLERIEDPVVLEILQDKREELDRQITLLSDRNTSRFIYGSLQLFGSVSPQLLETAKQILDQCPPRSREDSGGGHLNAEAFHKLALKEIENYRKKYPFFHGNSVIQEGLSSLLVSRGTLYVGHKMKIPKIRAYALLQHEIGTHMVTYFNGKKQPFKMLYSGLAGYDELQEGLAVLAEYLVGGLSRPRLRVLAARVLATSHLINGASFMDIFRELDRFYDFERKSAFTITLRVFRGGGITKDAVYLRGLIELLSFLQKGHSLDTLYAGKFSLKHYSIIQDLLFRKIINAPPVLPKFFQDPDSIQRLKELQKGVNVLDLVKR